MCVLELDPVRIRREDRIVRGTVLGVLGWRVQHVRTVRDELHVQRVDIGTIRQEERHVVQPRRKAIVRRADSGAGRRSNTDPRDEPSPDPPVDPARAVVRDDLVPGIPEEELVERTRAAASETVIST